MFALRALRARGPRHPRQYEPMLLPSLPLLHAVAAMPRHGRYPSLLVCRPATVDLH